MVYFRLPVPDSRRLTRLTREYSDDGVIGKTPERGELSDPIVLLQGDAIHLEPLVPRRVRVSRSIPPTAEAPDDVAEMRSRTPNERGCLGQIQDLRNSGVLEFGWLFHTGRCLPNAIGKFFASEGDIR